MNILDLFIYPIKSTKGQELNESIVQKTGLKNDRSFAIMDSKGKIITARENPKTLKIKVFFDDSLIRIESIEKEPIHFDLKNLSKEKVDAILFGTTIKGLTIDPKIDQWISEILNQECQLIILDSEHPRYGVSEKNPILFPDTSPIHLISKKSLDDLNSRLKNKVDVNFFRPNLFISGEIPYEEDNWDSICIGECVFKVVTKTKRCVFININPMTGERDIDSEPLKTLSKYRKHDNRVHFGINLIPTKLGTIKKHDEIKILSTVNDSNTN
ncbi:MAG: hypothetical protein CL868_03955 [Cytophagaceae bacterium]|nr:hypothetical protein [Cytophagaceae bacterium]|tara:strand:- start:3226 stop:4035 length:810 start_codon:yes stop_codon:yes gene_type:complete